MAQSRKPNENAKHENTKPVDQTAAAAAAEAEGMDAQAKANLENNPPLEEGEQPEKSKGGETFTYVGAGEDSPRVINFMGKQKFVRGEATKVSDPALIKKLKGNPTFVAGKADQETLHRIDEEGKAQADRQRGEDKQTQANYTRNQQKLAKHGD